jgi:hypothetical protein
VREEHWYITELLIRTETLKQMRITYAGGKAFEVYISLTYPRCLVLLAHLSQLNLCHLMVLFQIPKANTRFSADP